MNRTVLKPTAPVGPPPGRSIGAYPRPNFEVIPRIVVHPLSIITTIVWRTGDPPYDQDASEADFPLRLGIFE